MSDKKMSKTKPHIETDEQYAKRISKLEFANDCDPNDKIGLISGYKPNRISLYILMLTTGRHDELLECLYKDMEKYKENNENN